MKNKHVVLIYPRPTRGYTKERRRDIHSIKRIYPALSIMTLAATLEGADFPVLLLDHRLESLESMRDKISNLGEILFFGISTMTGSQIKYGLEIAAYLRSFCGKEIPLVWGGVHPTIYSEKTINHPLVDIIAYGEGDYTVVELAKALTANRPLDTVRGLYFKLNGKIVKTEPNAKIDPIDLLPMPSWMQFKEHLNRAQYPILATITTSRGCPYNCTYCYKWSVDSVGSGKVWRPFSTEHIMREVEYLNRNFGFDIFEMSDENFILDPLRTLQLIRAFKSKNYKISCIRSNFLTYKDKIIDELPGFCDYVGYAPETGSAKIQSVLNKRADYNKMRSLNARLRDIGITTVHAFIFGFPFETDEDIKATVNLCKDFKRINPACRMALYQYMPYPGAPLTDMMISKYNLILPDDFEEWSKSDMYGELDLKFRPWIDKAKLIFLNKFQLLFNTVFNTYQPINKDILDIYNSNLRIRELMGDISSIPRTIKPINKYILNERLSDDLLRRYTDRLFI